MRYGSALFVLLLFVVAAPLDQARADVIALHPLQPVLTGEFSNLGPANQQIADDFQLLQVTTLESFFWYGRYGSAGFGVADPVDFSIRFFVDIGGQPATAPFMALNVTVNAVATGFSFGTIPWFSYSTLLPSLTLGPATYWVSVVETDPDTPAAGFSQWLWADTNTAGVRAFRNNDANPWNVSFDQNHAFTLTGTVPEPSTILLSTLGMLGLGYYRRCGARNPRRRNREQASAVNVLD